MANCKGCGNPSAETWCETCSDDLMVKLKRSLEEAKERKAETFRERMARSEKFLKARVERMVRYDQ